MKRYLLAYLATATTLLVLDGIWLGLIAMPIYQRGIGHLMAPQVNAPAALIFYAVYVVGLMIYAVTRPRGHDQWGSVLFAGALFGFFPYAAYDLTNLATLKDWPLSIAVTDIVWGMVLSALASAGGWAVFRKVP